MENCLLSVETLASLVDSLYDEVCIYDNQYRMVYINQACLRHYGYAPGDLIGKELPTFEMDNWWDTSVLPHVYQDKKTYAIRQKTKVGCELFTIAKPVLDEKGQVIYVVMSVRDTVEEHIVFTDSISGRLPTIKTTASLIWESPEMLAVVETANRLGKSGANCLLTGESGTGKSALAKYMHQTSDRRDGSFVAVNCASLPQELVESELFGYARGAFTGAKKEGKQGLFETAQKGTLLLDEISELPLSAQAKLLTAIQDREILPIGATKPIKIDVKLLSATNKDLTKLIETGKFRADLYYRLNVFELLLPPLRHRTGDILPLATAFLHEFDLQYKKNHHFSTSAIHLLETYSWPGNIRELRHTMERLAVMVDDLVIDTQHLPQQLFKMETLPVNPVTQTSVDLPFDQAISQLEHQLITQSYMRHSTSRGVAQDLEISQTRAIKLIQKYITHPEK